MNLVQWPLTGNNAGPVSAMEARPLCLLQAVTCLMLSPTHRLLCAALLPLGIRI